jgi:hypothetical protein
VRKKNHTCSNWEKTVEIPSQSGTMELHKIFQPAAVCFSGDVPMYKPGLKVRVLSNAQVRSAYLTWRLFLSCWVGLISWKDARNHRQLPTYQMRVLR